MKSRTHEIKKQVIGEDTDPENSGKILNRVIKRGGDGITIDADQRQVRETSKDFESERANHATTPRTVETKIDDSAISDGSKGENQCEQGQCQTKYDRGDTGDGDDEN